MDGWMKRQFYSAFCSDVKVTKTSLLCRSQRNLVHDFPPHYLKINFNIILPFTPRFSKWLFPSGLRTKTLCTPLLFPTRDGGGGGGAGSIRRRKRRSYLNYEYIYIYVHKSASSN